MITKGTVFQNKTETGMNALCPECGEQISIDATVDATICPCCKKPIITQKALELYKSSNTVSVEDQARVVGQKVVDSVVGLVKQIDDDPEAIKKKAQASGQKMIGSISGFVGGAVGQVRAEKEERERLKREAEEKEKLEEELEQQRLDEERRIEREKRKTEFEQRAEEMKQSAKKHKPLVFIGALVLIVLFILLGVSSANKKANDTRIPVTVGASQLLEMNYETALQILKDAGFTNITLDPDYDVVLGLFASEGEIESVSINGYTSFNSSSKFNADDLIIIKYHDSISNNPSLNNPSKDAPQNNEEGSAINYDDIPVPEYAKRAAVVAWTNSMAQDVWNSDGSDYVPEKFHSYSDMSGTLTDYFIYVDSWGTWKTVGENKYHVDYLNLRYHDSYNVKFEYALSMDVDYNEKEKTYKISELRYSSDSENEKYGPFYTEELCYTVAQSLVEDDRDEKELDSVDKTDELTEAQAITAFRTMGELLYPYGFKCHIITGTRKMTQAADGSWYVEMEVTITNQYGAKRDAIASAYINNTTKAVEDFKVK